MFPPLDLPLILGLAAFLSGLLALATAIRTTNREHSHLQSLPLHQIKLEVDGTATVFFTLHSAAAPQALATSLVRRLAGSSSPAPTVLTPEGPLILAP